MPARGKLAVFAILLLAACMAGGGWWWNYQRGRRCLELYGSEAAYLIRTAPKVELLTEDSATIDLSRAAGLIHARTALLDDVSYVWDAPPATRSDDFHAVRFIRGNTHVTLEFSSTGNTVFVAESGRGATLDQKTADGWRAFIRRQLAPQAAAQREPAP
jgi:hypothetical protein